MTICPAGNLVAAKVGSPLEVAHSADGGQRRLVGRRVHVPSGDLAAGTQVPNLAVNVEDGRPLCNHRLNFRILDQQEISSEVRTNAERWKEAQAAAAAAASAENPASGARKQLLKKMEERNVSISNAKQRCVVREERERESPQFYLIYPQRLKGPILSYFTPSASAGPPFQTLTLSNRNI